MKKSILLSLAICVFAGCSDLKTETPGNSSPQFELMNLYKPGDISWDKAIPEPVIPPPPSGTGLTDMKILKDAEPINVEGDAQLAAIPGITGKGTQEEPYVIENLKFTVKDIIAININKTSKHLLLRNIQFNGIPESAFSPSQKDAIHIGNSKNIRIENCEVFKCQGFYIGGSSNCVIKKCKLLSTIHGIMSSGGSNITAEYNHVEDAVKYGIFLYNGPDHVIAHNYVAWTGREGIGTNGSNCRNHNYHDNVIMHCGWTAINVEGTNVKGANDNTIVENNFVKDTFYGIIIMGENTLCRNNKVYYSGQDGIIIITNENVKSCRIEDNLIVGSSQNGIWAMQKSSHHTIKGNKILQSGTGIKNEADGSLIEKNDIFRFFYGIENKSNKSVIKENNIYQGRNGLSLTNNNPVEITGNKFSYLCIGLGGKCANSKIEKNNFVYVGHQLRLSDSENVIISDNTFRHQAYLGADLTQCTKCIVENNTFDNATMRSIKISGGTDNIVRGNKISDVYAQFNGAALILENTNNNIISKNIFKSCAVAILLGGKGKGLSGGGSHSLKASCENVKNNRFEKNIYENNKENLRVFDKTFKEQILQDNILDTEK